MKKGLMLSQNQSMRFNDFFDDIQKDSHFFDYSGYSDLLYIIDSTLKHPASFLNLDTERYSFEYSGAYITGYTAVEGCTDLAIAAAYICAAEKIPVADSELTSAHSLSKISESVKLALSGILIPKTYGGTKIAILRALATKKIHLSFPVIFKAADGRRGIDNYTIYNENEIYDYFQDKPDNSVWIIQKFIECDGFYRLNAYFYNPAYAIYRTNEPDKVERHHIHMYKPSGGINATFIPPDKIPRSVTKIAKKAAKVLGREFAGIDLVVGKKTDRVFVIEVNNCPQLVTVESFRKERSVAFLDAMRKLTNQK